jgi:hypothetical protein
MRIGGVPLLRCVFNRISVLAVAALISACATTHKSATYGAPTPRTATASHAPSNVPAFTGMEPRVVATKKPLQCVPYARRETGVEIYGNANTWWAKAAGKYRRDRTPAPGTVMAFRGSPENPHGHVAVVREVRSSRILIVDHANWLGRGEVTVATPIIDISPRNDWSQVRVWFIPGDQWGARTFKIAGFIYPERTLASMASR